MPFPHRKRVRHFDTIPEPHELTFSCYRRLPLLNDEGRNLRSQRAIAAAINYTHANPARRGLVASAADWKWSSVRWYASDARVEEPDLPRLTPLPADCWPGPGDFSG